MPIITKIFSPAKPLSFNTLGNYQFFSRFLLGYTSAVSRCDVMHLQSVYCTLVLTINISCIPPAFDPLECVSIMACTVYVLHMKWCYQLCGGKVCVFLLLNATCLQFIHF